MIDEVKEGDEVAFELTESKKGLNATNVEVINNSTFLNTKNSVIDHWVFCVIICFFYKVAVKSIETSISKLTAEASLIAIPEN